jgi:hypothetical protein
LFYVRTEDKWQISSLPPASAQTNQEGVAALVTDDAVNATRVFHRIPKGKYIKTTNKHLFKRALT